jgi:hypothetical protein
MARSSTSAARMASSCGTGRPATAMIDSSFAAGSSRRPRRMRRRLVISGVGSAPDSDSSRAARASSSTKKGTPCDSRTSWASRSSESWAW